MAMSYAAINPSFYQVNQPNTPWHAGSPGWTRAPWVTWGGNPRQVGPSRQGVGALGITLPIAQQVVEPWRSLAKSAASELGMRARQAATTPSGWAATARVRASQVAGARPRPRRLRLPGMSGFLDDLSPGAQLGLVVATGLAVVGVYAWTRKPKRSRSKARA
jgi:hypothetical protein